MPARHPWIDVSVTLDADTPHWPDNPPFRTERFMSLDRGDIANVSRLDLGAHTATHMDAPLHFIPGGATIDELDLDAVVGPARVIAIDHPEAVTPEDLAPHDLRPGERILFRTRNSPAAWHAGGFVEDFVYISAAAAAVLVRAGVRTVGVDYLSVGGFSRDGPETHHVLLEAGVWIIEGLDLSGAEPGDYDLVCLPLKIAGGDGAPARALLRRRD